MYLITDADRTSAEAYADRILTFDPSYARRNKVTRADLIDRHLAGAEERAARAAHDRQVEAETARRQAEIDALPACEQAIIRARLDLAIAEHADTFTAANNAAVARASAQLAAAEQAAR